MSTIQYTDKNGDITILVARHVVDVRMSVQNEKTTFSFWMVNQTSSEATVASKDSKDLLRSIKQVIGNPDRFSDIYL